METQTQSQDYVPQVKVGMVPVDSTPVDTKHVFFCYGPPTLYYFQNGKTANFRYGLVPGHEQPAFVTNIKGYIDELNAQIAQGHPVFFVKKDLKTVTDEQLDPFADIKAQAVREYQAKLMQSSEEAKKILNAMGVGTPDPSVTDSKPSLQGIATSMNVHEGMADSSSAVEVAGGIAATAGAMETNKVNAPDVSANPLASLLRK